MKTLLNVTETYRVDSEEEVKQAIEDAKNDAEENGYLIKGHSSKMKEKKSKGEVIDEGWEITIKKEYNLFWEV